MNRRSFFNSIGAIIGAASLSPNIFIPKFEPVRWKVSRQVSPLPWRPHDYWGEWSFVCDEMVLRDHYGFIDNMSEEEFQMAKSSRKILFVPHPYEQRTKLRQ